MCMSPVLQTLQFNWGLTPLMFWRASKILGVGFFLKNVGLYISTGTGLSLRDTGFNVPLITISSKLLSSFKSKSTVWGIPERVIVFVTFDNPANEADRM